MDSLDDAINKFNENVDSDITLAGFDGFICQECGKELPTESGLKRHTTRMHGERDIAPGSSVRKTNTPKRDPFRDEYKNFLTQIGLLASAFNFDDGMTIIKNADRSADAMAQFARSRPKVKKTVQSLIGMNDYYVLFTAHAAIAIPILMNHNIIKKPGSGAELEAPNSGVDSAQVAMPENSVII